MDDIVTILLGILLTTSEILPYIKQIKSNGILEFFTNTIVEIVRLKLNSLHIPDSQETRPLLQNNNADANSNYTTYTTYTIDTINTINTIDTIDTTDTTDTTDFINQNLNFSSNLNENLKVPLPCCLILKVPNDVNININSGNVLLKFNKSNVQISFDVNDKNSDVEINKNLDIIN